MKITQIKVYKVDLPLEHPYWLSGGRLKFEVLDATLVRIDTDAGPVRMGRRNALGPHLRCRAWSWNQGRN